MSSYNKPYKSIDEHIELLKNRGLKITNEDFAKNLLKSLNYYNFSGYLYVFEKKNQIKEVISLKIQLLKKSIDFLI